MHFVIHFYSDHIIVVLMLLKYASKCYEFDASKGKCCLEDLGDHLPHSDFFNNIHV